MGRYLGNRGKLLADVSTAADATELADLTEIPFIKELAPNQERPDIDVTAMGDTEASNLKDFPGFNLTVQVFDDSETNILDTLGDGKDRMVLYCFDKDATTKKGGHGIMQGSWSPKATVRQGVEGTLSLTSSSGGITKFFAASIPDPFD